MATDRREQIHDLDQETEPSPLAPEADTSLLPEGIEDSPAESPTAVEDYGVTAAEEVRDEPLSQRLHREIPDIPAGYRPTDPDRLAATGFAGRLAENDGPHVAAGDIADFTPEETAMHLVPGPRTASTGQPRTHADRLDLLEAQVTVLLRMAQIHTEALAILAEALERLPTEEPDEAPRRVSRAAHTAHELLLTLRGVPT